MHQASIDSLAPVESRRSLLDAGHLAARGAPVDVLRDGTLGPVG